MASTEPKRTLAALEERLGHCFREPELLHRALIHASAAERGDRGNERLEFLGDRVLGLIVAEALLARFPREAEGEIAKRHARLVSRAVLAPIGRALGLDGFLVMARADAPDASVPDTVLADGLEALIAALYLDGGLETARHFVLGQLDRAFEEDRAPPRDAKTALQEWALGRGLGLPVYEALSREGPAHAPVFEVEVRVEGRGSARASGSSKQKAEQAAAQLLLARLDQDRGS